MEVRYSAMTRSYKGEVAKLAPLETFDSQVFMPDERADKSLCDFVLALALAFNDLKDLLLLHSLLLGEKEQPTAPTPALGMLSGAHFHALRLLLGFVFELLQLLEDNQNVIKSRAFQEGLRKVPKGTRSAWEKLLEAAQAQPSSDPDVKFLILARNTVAYHYDPKVVGRGYRAQFVNNPEPPFVSRGSNLSSSRFYFAEASAQRYLQQQYGEASLTGYFTKQPDFLSDIGLCIYQLVTSFINSRSGWRAVDPIQHLILRCT